MSLQDRDYMRRPPDEDRSSAENRLESAVGNFFVKHPHFFIYAGIGLTVLLILAVALAMLSDR